MGPGGLRRGPPHVRELLRRRGPLHQALPARAAAPGPDPPLPADDRHPPQRQGSGLPVVPRTARPGPFRGQVPARRPPGRRNRPAPPPDEGGTGPLRRQAAVPRAPRLHRAVRAERTGSRALRSGHPLCSGGDGPGQALRRHRPETRRQCGLRAHRPAAPPRLLAGGDPPEPQTPPRPDGGPPRPAPGGGAGRRAARGPRPLVLRPRARRGRPRRSERGGDRGRRGAGARPRHRRRHHGGTRDRDRHAPPPRTPGARRPPPGHRRQVAPVERDPRRPADEGSGRHAAQAHRLHRTAGHPSNTSRSASAPGSAAPARWW